MNDALYSNPSLRRQVMLCPLVPMVHWELGKMICCLGLSQDAKKTMREKIRVGFHAGQVAVKP